MNIIKSPNSITKHHQGGAIVFLAGSIEMGKAADWQAIVEQHFASLPDYTLLNPRRDDWDHTCQQTFEDPYFSQQVNWELNGLERADRIIMYLAPNTKSPISLLELGLFASSGKLLVCCPEGFWRKGNVDIVCEKYNIPNYKDLEQLLEQHF
ncbi:MAG: nucleoside 2-deoxyribosyltransferase domain-containing protein [Bacteroidota bacterium]